MPTDEPTRDQHPDDGATASAAPATQPHAVDPQATTPTAHSLVAASAMMFPGYEIVGELGRGAMGVVYEARQAGLNRTVALKMVIAGPYAAASTRARFLIEAEAVAALEHPHIVRVFAFGEHGGHPFLAMEHLPGGTLSQLLRSRGPLPGREAATLLAKLAGAVAHAHARGVVHRDIKPGNVLLTADGEPRLTDFGLAKVGRSDMTATGAILGTPAYMSPEQAAGKVHEVGTPADVYALGAVLYDLLTGRPPFQGDSQAATLQLVLTAEPERPRSLNRAIPHDLETICLKCLEKAPAKRYPTAQAVADELNRYLIGEPIEARPAGTMERVLKWVRRKPTRAALVVLVPLTIAVSWALTVYVRLSTQREQLLDRREGEQAIARASLYFENKRIPEAVLWAARGLEHLERTGASDEDQWEARMQLSLWGQSVAWRRLSQLPVDKSNGNYTADVVPDGRSILAHEIRPDGELIFVRMGVDGGRVVFPYGNIEKVTARWRCLGANYQYIGVLTGDSSRGAPPVGKPIVDGDDEAIAANMHWLYDFASGQLVRCISFPEPMDRRIRSWSPDLTRLVLTNSRTRKAELWDTREGKRIAELDTPIPKPENRWPLWYGFTQSGERFWALGEDQVLRLWSPSDGHLVAVIRHPEPKAGVLTGATASDPPELLTGGMDGTLRRWDLDGKPVGQPLADHLNWSHVVVEKPARYRCANAFYCSELPTPRNKGGMSVTWHLDTGQRLREAVDPEMLSPDRRVAFVPSVGKFTDLGSGNLFGPGLVQGGGTRMDPKLTYTPDSRCLIVDYPSDYKICIFGTNSGRLLASFDAVAGGFVPNSDRVLVVQHTNLIPAGGGKEEHTYEARAIYLKPLEGPAERITRWAEWLTHSQLDGSGGVTDVRREPGKRFLHRIGELQGDLREFKFDNEEPDLPPWR